jgi:outer membrane lipoprotein carrier protein
MRTLLTVCIACFGIRAAAPVLTQGALSPVLAMRPAEAMLAVAPAAAPKDGGAAPKDGGTAAKPAERQELKPGATPRPVMAPDVEKLVERLQAFYEKTQDFSAGFRQDYTYKAFKKTVTSTGKVTFKKPALMRWEYETPNKKTFVLNNDKVYMHDPDAMTLTKANAGQDKLSASVTFLWGKGKLADEFAIAKKDCATCKGTLLELTPLKSDPRFNKVFFEVDPVSAQVMKSTVVDPDGSENAIAFTTLALNTGVKDEFFKLAPPAGTQMMDLTGGTVSPTPSK